MSTELLINLLFGVIFGVVAVRADFCFHGILSEPLVLKSKRKIWGLVALWIAFIVFFYPFAFLVAPDLIPPVKTFPRLAHFVGGAILGYGMVLAGGCPFGTLYRIGKGYAQSMFAGLGFVVGLVIYTLLYPKVLAPFIAGELYVYKGLSSLIELFYKIPN